MPELIYTSADRIKARMTVDDGLCIQDMAKLLNPISGHFVTPTLAFRGGTPVLRKEGGWLLPEIGDTIIIFVELPMGGGGGSNPIAAIFAVIAIAVMWWNPGAWIAGSTMLGLTGAAATVTAGLINTGILMGLGLLSGAIAGSPKIPQGHAGAMNAAAASPTYNINASGNQARLFQPEPEGFGRMLITPDFAAQTWMQYINNEQYGYFVYTIGRGSYLVEALQYGDTVFWRNGSVVGSGYDDVAVQIVEPGQKVTLFPDNVITSAEVSGQELFAPNADEYEGAVGPFVTNPPGTKITQILLDVVLGQGLGRYDDHGNLNKYKVACEFSYRAIDDFGRPVSGWTVLKTFEKEEATRTAQRITLPCAVSPGRYEVDAKRTSDSSNDGRTLEAMHWTAMRGMLPGSLTFPVSVIALRIRASNTLTQGASARFKALISRKLPLYDLATRQWSAEVATRSWAAAVCAVCKASWGGQVRDDQLDLDALWGIDARLQAKGWRYDAYIDGAYNVWQLLTEMCQSQVCIPRMSGTIFSVVEDQPGRPARYILSPRNIRRGTFKVSWNTWSEQTPDDVTVIYLDSDYGYQQRDVTATLPESDSRETTSMDVMGIVNREHAFGVAVAYGARNRWRRIVVDCDVEGLGRRLAQGDVCSVVHPRFREAASGTLRAWQEAGLMLQIKLEAGAVPETKDKYLALTAADGEAWGPVKLDSIIQKDPDMGIYEVRLDADDYTTLILQGHGYPWPWLTLGSKSQPTVWTLQSAKQFSRRMIVQSVQPIDLWHYSVSLVNDDDRVGSYGHLPVPPWQGRAQIPVDKVLAAPQGLSVRIVELGALAQLDLAWLAVAGAGGYEVEMSVSASSSGERIWQRTGRVTLCSTSIEVPHGPVQVRVAAVSDFLMSSWVLWNGLTGPAPAAG